MQVTVSNLNPSTEGGVILSQRFNDLKANVYSSHLGADDVPYAVRGMISTKDLGSDQVELRYFDGASHIALGTIDEDADIFTPAGQADGVPVGTVVKTACSSAPTGWLLCYGQAVGRATYSDLFDAIGTAYGAGDGSTTFNLPDLRGRVAAGVDNMGGSAAGRLTSTVMSPDGNTLGAVGGSQTHTLSTAQLPPHNHELKTSTAAGANATYLGVSHAGTLNANKFTENAGSGAAHNNTQPTILLNYMIKT
jgi:microcystin-dependent protein